LQKYSAKEFSTFFQFLFLLAYPAFAFVAMDSAQLTPHKNNPLEECVMYVCGPLWRNVAQSFGSRTCLH
jgi:hypothetical protein